MSVIAEILPHPHGFLEFFFLGMLLSLLVAVGLFGSAARGDAWWSGMPFARTSTSSS